MTIPFEDHCWKDIVDADTTEIYQAYQRNVYVGPRPVILAIDLYKSAYRGGPRPVVEVNRSFPGSCGENAWKAARADAGFVRRCAPRRRASHLYDAACRHRRRALDQSK